MVVEYSIMPTDVQTEIISQTNKEGGCRLELYDAASVEKKILAVGCTN